MKVLDLMLLKILRTTIGLLLARSKRSQKRIVQVDFTMERTIVKILTVLITTKCTKLFHIRITNIHAACDATKSIFNVFCKVQIIPNIFCFTVDDIGCT